MRLEFLRRDHDGITVPYPPLCDEIRNNRGFTDLRGKPKDAAEVAEALQSAALKELLVALAQPSSAVFTLACDIGAHRKKEQFSVRREVTGGYVHVLSSKYDGQTPERYHAFSVKIGNALHAAAGRSSWSARFELTPVQFNLDDYRRMVWSVSVWFFAEHKSPEGAVSSRERLIRALHEVLTGSAAAIFNGA